MKFKGIIFDLDGVICFTDKYHYQAWKQMADKEGIYFDEIINNRLRGVSRMASLEIILERADKAYTEEEKEQMAYEKNETYKKLLYNCYTVRDCRGCDYRTEYCKNEETIIKKSLPHI